MAHCCEGRTYRRSHAASNRSTDPRIDLRDHRADGRPRAIRAGRDAGKETLIVVQPKRIEVPADLGHLLKGKRYGMQLVQQLTFDSGKASLQKQSTLNGAILDALVVVLRAHAKPVR